MSKPAAPEEDAASAADGAADSEVTGDADAAATEATQGQKPSPVVRARRLASRARAVVVRTPKPLPEPTHTGLSRMASGSRVPLARERALHRVRLNDAFTGWVSSIAVFLLSLFLRLWQLGQPKSFLFDETYYAKDAWSLLHFGYVKTYGGGADASILKGQTTGLWNDEASMIVHPEVGKWMIALGEKAFGMTPFGWRVSAAVVGSLMILLMIRFVRRLTGSTALGLMAGLLLSFDGMQFTLSRMALLDIFVAFFMLLGVHLVVMDRDWFRRRLARKLAAREEAGQPVGAVGPVRALLFRPYLVLAGISFGLAVGTKWDAAYPLAAFGLLSWAWTAGARRSFGISWPVLKSAVVDAVPAFFQLVLVALLVYVASWTGWLMHASAYEADRSSTTYTRFVSWDGTCGDDEQMLHVNYDSDKRWPTATEPDAKGFGEVTQSLRSLAYYHEDVLTFHRFFLNCATHSYASKPSGWLLVNRPVGADAQTDIKPGERGCDAPQGSDCLKQVLIIGNPVLWWGGCVALVAALVLWIGTRDWRFGVAVVGAAVTWLPWLFFDTRPIFSFYAVLTLPFLVLAITLVLGKLIGPSRLPSGRRTLGVIVAGSYFVLVLVNFAWFWPIWTDQLLTHDEWMQRIWFQRWI